MENEEKDDLLVEEISDDSETESEFCIDEKITGLLDAVQKNKSWKRDFCVIFASLLLFFSSTALLITLPIYVEQTRRCGISFYSKLASLVTIQTILFATVFIINLLLTKYFPKTPCCTAYIQSSLPRLLKISGLVTLGTLIIFYLEDSQLVSCHLQDPLKGCVVVFSFAYCFIFAKRKTSVERIFCLITVIVGTFIAVDFGLCDRYRCRGMDYPESAITHPLCWRVIYIIAYILALGLYTMHLIFMENSCSSPHCSSNLDVSIVSNETRIERPTAPIAQSLSIISGCRRDLDVSIPVESVAEPKYPVTSTPNESPEAANRISVCAWLAFHHAIFLAMIVLACWVPTLLNSESRLVDIFADYVKSIESHTIGSECPSLWAPSAVFIVFYVVFSFSSMAILCQTSALAVVCVCMNALPMASIFWSFYQLNPSTTDILTFKMSMTGETISSLLGFPIIGIGTFLLLKSHITQNIVLMRLR